MIKGAICEKSSQFPVPFPASQHWRCCLVGQDHRLNKAPVFDELGTRFTNQLLLKQTNNTFKKMKSASVTDLSAETAPLDSLLQTHLMFQVVVKDTEVSECITCVRWNSAEYIEMISCYKSLETSILGWNVSLKSSFSQSSHAVKGLSCSVTSTHLLVQCWRRPCHPVIRPSACRSKPHPAALQ